jgi:hypothetical protein
MSGVNPVLRLPVLLDAMCDYGKKFEFKTFGGVLIRSRVDSYLSAP